MVANKLQKMSIDIYRHRRKQTSVEGLQTLKPNLILIQMKKANLLSKAEMKNVTGGNGGIDCSGPWWTRGLDNCYICCLRADVEQPAPVDPDYSPYEFCMNWCTSH